MIDFVAFSVKSIILALAIVGGTKIIEPTPVENTRPKSPFAPIYTEPAPFHFNSGVIENKDELCEKHAECKKLAEAVFFESRGEPIDGQYAVAYAVINRRDTENRWGDTVTSVVNQKIMGNCQFSYVCELNNDVRRKMISNNPESWSQSLEVAFNVFNFEVPDLTNGADHFYNPRKVSRTPHFAKVYEYVATIGEHKFYRSN